MTMNGSEIIVNVLKEEGVDTVFGYPGGAMLHIYDALYKHSDEIEHIITAHEQGAAHAADGYARVSGKTGVVLATSGPGATNLVTGIATAYMDSVPMVAITGNVGSALIGKDSFQEVYTMGITMPITKHNYTVQRVEELADTLREAFYIARSGRQGPVLIDITKDVTMAEYAYTPQEARENGAAPVPKSATIKEMTALLDGAEKPLIYFGGGVIAAGAEEALYNLVHSCDIPAVHTLMATGVLSCDDPLNLGLVGMHGFASSNKAIDAADLVLTVGTRFSDRVALNTEQFAPNAKIIQIDIDPSEMNKNVSTDLHVVGDAKDVLLALLESIEDCKNDRWTAQIKAWKAEDLHPADTSDALRPHQLLETVNDFAGEDAIFTTDVGQHQMWAAQYCRRVKPRGFLTSGGLGTMGYGYGAAIGAQKAAPGRRVIHLTGDGSFHMNLNEVVTAITYQLPIISVILNNQVLGMVRQWQNSFYDSRYSCTTLERKTDYVKVAEGFGGTGYRVTTPQQLKDALEKAQDATGPVWIDCVIDRDEKVLPMIPAGGTLDDIIID